MRLKTLAAVCTLFILAGCGGWGGDITYAVTRVATLTGGNIVQGVDFHTTTFSTKATVTGFTWDIPRNNGGGGTLGVGFTSIGGDCAIVSPVDTLSFPPYTVTQPTQGSQLLVDALNQYKDVPDYRVCFYVTPTDVAAPIDIDFKVIATGTEHVGL